MQNSTGYLAATLFSGFLLVGAVAFSPAASAQDETEGVLEEVYVTAQKRTETLLEIPMSVTVLSGDTLERQQADNFQDLVSMVPGFSLESSQRGFSRVTLRGINTGGSASTVGVYVDDVPFGTSGGLANGSILAGDFDTFDLARIEVLRGPQGTLYGASSLGGVLKYVPNAPSTEGFEARFQGSVESVEDGDTGYAATGVVNIPLSDTFAVRASAFSRSDEGFIDSIGNNPIGSLTDPNANVIEGTRVDPELNHLDTTGGRLSALFQPSDTFSLNLTLQAQDIESGAPDTIDADAATLAPLNSSPVQSRYQEAFSNIEYRVYSAKIGWDFGGASLESVTSDGSIEQHYQQDAALATALAGVPLSSLLTLLFGQNLSAVLPQTTSTDKFTQEFRLLSPDNDKFEWLIGAYYTDEDSLIDQTIVAVDAGTENPAAGFPLLAVANLTSNYEELAFFANATWHIKPDFELSFGARTSDNEQVARQVTSGPLAGDSDFSVNSSETPFTWSISPRWQLSDTSSVYARVATGFRPGGPNVVPPSLPDVVPRTYDSDSLTSYEVGYKSTSSDGKFSMDVAAYFLDWEDVQLVASFGGFGVNANGGTAESKGVEFSTSFFPRDGLAFTLNGAYTDAQLTSDTDPALGGLNGDPLSYVPEWSFGLGGDYEWSVLGDKIAYVGGNLGYTGSRPGDLGNRTAGGTLYEVDSYTTLNLRAGIESGRWLFEIYAKNVTDESGYNSVSTADSDFTGRAELGVIRPSTFGLSIGVKF